MFFRSDVLSSQSDGLRSEIVARYCPQFRIVRGDVHEVLSQHQFRVQFSTSCSSPRERDTKFVIRFEFPNDFDCS